MFKTREISIRPIFRFLLGVLGIFDAVIGLFLAVRELWFVSQGEWWRLLSFIILLIIISAGVYLLRSAIRGQLLIRSYRRKDK